MNTSINSSYQKEVATEDIPLLSADPDLKARGIANTSLFDFQSIMNGNVKPEAVREYTAKLRYFLSNYSAVQEDGTTQVLVDGSYKRLSGIVFNDPTEHEFLLTAHVASIEEKDLIPQRVTNSDSRYDIDNNATTTSPHYIHVYLHALLLMKKHKLCKTIP